MTHPNGTKEIVVASGYSAVTGNITEILNLDSLTWRLGPHFPSERKTIYGTSMQYGDSFLAIGGETQDYGFRNETWYFNPENYQWEVMAILEQERSLPAAIALSENTCD